MSVPVVQSCREELESLRREGREPALVERLSQLVSLHDFATRLVWTARGDEIPEAVLGFVMDALEADSGLKGHRFELTLTAPELKDPIFVKFEVK